MAAGDRARGAKTGARSLSVRPKAYPSCTVNMVSTELVTAAEVDR